MLNQECYSGWCRNGPRIGGISHFSFLSPKFAIEDLDFCGLIYFCGSSSLETVSIPIFCAVNVFESKELPLSFLSLLQVAIAHSSITLKLFVLV